jgi:HipA-like protein
MNHGMIEKAAVYYGRREAGTLQCRPDGFEFIYHTSYRSDPQARPITRRMSLRKARHAFKNLFPALDNVLPEGWLINLFGETHHLDESEKFSLLLHMGGDALGPVSLVPMA